MVDVKIKTLLTIVETGNYTRAAQLLNLTQPAVSHHIRMLEEEYGIKIFNRNKKELLLTQQRDKRSTTAADRSSISQLALRRPLLRA